MRSARLPTRTGCRARAMSAGFPDRFCLAASHGVQVPAVGGVHCRRTARRQQLAPVSEGWPLWQRGTAFGFQPSAAFLSLYPTARRNPSAGPAPVAATAALATTVPVAGRRPAAALVRPLAGTTNSVME